MSRPEVSRRDESGDRIAIIHSYAPGDGDLSFVAKDPHTHKALSPSPTEEECKAACPYGWILYNNGSEEYPTWTRGLKKPFDYVLMGAMVVTGESVAKEMSGFKLGYHQSDEFSFVITDTDS